MRKKTRMKQVWRSSDVRCVLAICSRTRLWMVPQMVYFHVLSTIYFHFHRNVGFLKNSTCVWWTDGRNSQRTGGQTDGRTDGRLSLSLSLSLSPLGVSLPVWGGCFRAHHWSQSLQGHNFRNIFIFSLNLPTSGCFCVTSGLVWRHFRFCRSRNKYRGGTSDATTSSALIYHHHHHHHHHHRRRRRCCCCCCCCCGCCCCY